MATIFDVAKYILEKSGPMTAMKLQKLAYYSQAWSLVWDEEPLFNEEFQAWANGPVCSELYNEHRGQFKVDESQFSGNSKALTENQKDSIDKVLSFYGSKTAQWLSDLTHRESPWLDTRDGLPLMAKCNYVIPKAAMHEYYSSL
ncbi:Panacea domain-containing protein [Marinobacter nauticus]|uniref:Panacea domain-containing protein n=1 Tax=Marinobacter nauticus TaxID=2743 RepID=UPI001F25F7DC|nr:type II toxin-antitoxin system antitoxin SocA domain-containing protein [Marinobacter nauticus]